MKTYILLLLLVLLGLSLASHGRHPEAAIEDTTLVHRADYQICVPVRNGPITPLTAKSPFQRQKGVA